MLLSNYGVPQAQYDELKKMYDLKELELTEAQKRVNETYERMERLMDRLEAAESNKLLLEDKISKMAVLEEELNQLKKRNFIERLFKRYE